MRLPRRTSLPLAVASVSIAAAVGIALLGSATGGPTAGASLPIAVGSLSSPLAATSRPPTSASVPPAPSFDGQTPGPSPSANVAPTARPRDAALSASLDATLQALRAKLAIPGMSVAIVFADGTTWTGTAGMADVADGTAVTDGTAFAIASMSKTFTAATVLQLVEDGRLRLDEPVAPLLPSLALDRRITVRMLLDHTSGLYDYFLNTKIDRALQAKPTATWTLERALTYVRKPYFPPGKGWHYSNTNYLLLGALVERVTGGTMADQIRTRFLDPLTLDDTWYQVAERPRADTAHGYRVTGTSTKLRPIDLADGTGIMPFRSVVTAADGAGSIAATSRDVARWAWLLYGGRVLDPSTFAAMVDDAETVARFKPRVPYGLGVQLVPIGRFATLGHSGRFLGFRGVVRYLPSEDLSIAVLTNQSRADPALVLRALLDVIYPPPTPAPTPSASLGPGRGSTPAPSATGIPLGPAP